MKIVNVDIAMSGTIKVVVPDNFQIPPEGATSEQMLVSVHEWIDWHDLPNHLEIEVGDIWSVINDTI